MRGDHLLKHWATTQNAITLSSGEAELTWVVKGVAEGLGLQSLLLDLGVSAEIEVHADSAAAIGICRRSGIGRVRHLAVCQLWVQEKLREGAFRLFKVAGAENPADLLTKYQPANVIQEHTARMGVFREEGRVATAPQVTAQVTPWLGYDKPVPPSPSSPPRSAARPVRAPPVVKVGGPSGPGGGAGIRAVGFGPAVVHLVPPTCPDRAI